MTTPKRPYLVTFVLIASLTTLLPLALAQNEAYINPRQFMAEADLANGKAIYTLGRHPQGAHIAYNGGPNWLHVDGGGCAKCHGAKGRGDIVPDMCFSTTPPIAYRFLIKRGYFTMHPDSANQPDLLLRPLKEAVEGGINLDGYELEYCMPRWRFSDDDFRDLLAYLMSLDTAGH